MRCLSISISIIIIIIIIAMCDVKARGPMRDGGQGANQKRGGTSLAPGSFTLSNTKILTATRLL